MFMQCCPISGLPQIGLSILSIQDYSKLEWFRYVGLRAQPQVFLLIALPPAPHNLDSTSLNSTSHWLLGWGWGEEGVSTDPVL